MKADIIPRYNVPPTRKDSKGRNQPTSYNPKPAPSEVSPPMPLPSHPAPVREDDETRQFRITRRIQEMKDDLKGFLSSQNPTRGELVSAAISMRLLAKELDFAAAQLENNQ